MPNLTHAPEPTKSAAPAKSAAAPLRPTTPFFPPVYRPATTSTRPGMVGQPAPARPAGAPATQPAVARPRTAAPTGGGLVQQLPGWLHPVGEAVAEHAQENAPYRLLTLGLGYDPLTGHRVDRTPEVVGHALLVLLPNGEARFQQLRQASAALAQLPDWLLDQLDKCQLNLARLNGLVHNTLLQLTSLKVSDALDPAGTAARFAKPWLALGADVLRLLVTLEVSMLRLVVRAVLGEQAQPLLDALDQAGDLLTRILRNPLPFLRTLVAAAKDGFNLFVKRAPQHLEDAAKKWLFGPLADEGIDVPKVWTLRSVLDLLLQVLGLTKKHVLHVLRERVTAEVGPEAAARLEKLGEEALTLVTEGPAALWRDITQQAGDLLKQAFDAVQDQVAGMVAQGVAKLVAKLAVPGGALVQVLQTTWDVYQTVVSRAQEIARVGLALFGMVRSLEQGQTQPAAEALDGILSQLLRVALDFLARTFSLDKLPKLLRIGLQALRRPVDKGINWVLDKIIKLAKKGWQGIKRAGSAAVQAGRDAVGTVKGWLGFHEEFHTVDGATHELYVTEKEDEPRIMRASNLPQEIEHFLIDLRNQELRNSPPDAQRLADIQAALIAAQDVKATFKLITRTASANATPAASDTKKKLENKIVAKLKVLINTLPGLVPQAPLPPVAKTNWAPGVSAVTSPSDKQFMHVTYLTSASAAGGTGADGKTDEMDFVTGKPGHWVRMHLVTAAVGGPGTSENWVPAPHTTNIGGSVLRSFEQSAESLVRTQQLGSAPGQRPVIKNVNYRPAVSETKNIVMWINVDVIQKHPAVPVGPKFLYGFAKLITFEYGLYLPKGTTWQPLSEPISTQTVAVNLPPPPTFNFNLPTPIYKDGLRYTGNPFFNGSNGSDLCKAIEDGAGAYANDKALETHLLKPNYIAIRPIVAPFMADVRRSLGAGKLFIF